jgi:hypothetical protein
MYKTHVRPVLLTYASETWVLSKAGKRSLGLFERRVLRCIFGAVQDKGMWRKRYNLELYKPFNELDVIKHISSDHIIHMENSKEVKVFDTRPEGTRKIGRLKLRWDDGVTRISGLWECGHE